MRKHEEERLPFGVPDNVEVDQDGSMWHSDCEERSGPVSVWDEDMPHVLSCGGCGAIWRYQSGQWIEKEVKSQ